MKKFILLGASLLLLGSCAPCNFLVRGGANFGTIRGDETDDLSSRTAVFVGVGTECEVADLVAIRPELMYSQQGAEYEDSDGFDGRFKLDYLNVPVMAKLNVSDGFFVEAGPQIGFLLSAKDEYDSPTSGEDDIKDLIKSTDFGANIGLGYQFDNGLNIGARYNLGLTNINDVEDSPGFDFKNQNSVLSLGVGYKF